MYITDRYLINQKDYSVMSYDMYQILQYQFNNEGLSKIED